MSNQTICLNMIVKDEADIIINTLNNLIEHIDLDYWVICDTGSTDNTAELIETFFKEKDISGELIHDPWQDFAYNRTRALEFAYKKTDFVFIWDADDRLVGDLREAMPILKHGNAYQLQFGHAVQWKRMPLVDNHIKWYYEGVMHEIIGTKEPHNIVQIEGKYHVATNVEVSARNKKGSNKYYEDALILEKAFEKNDHLKPRYAFYAGECFRFSGKKNWDKSIHWYTLAANTTNQWPQERYWACFQLGNLYRDLGEKEKSWYWWYKAWEFDKQRQEAMFELIKECRAKNKFKQAEVYYNMLEYLPEKQKEHKLFIMNHIYDHSLYSEMVINYFYLGKMKKANDMLKKLFTAKKPIPQYINMTNYNLKYFLPHIERTDWEFYAKFQRYARKFNLPEDIIKSVDKLFEE